MPILVLILLIATWLILTGSYTLTNLLFGALLAGFVLFLLREHIQSVRRVRRPFKIARLGASLLYELVLSGWSVARIVWRRDMDLQPGLIKYKLKLTGDFEIAMLANFITLTPGTLTVDVTPDRKFLLVHALDARDPDSIRESIANGFERQIMEAFN